VLVYIDESGHPRPGDPTQRPVLLAVCIKEADVGHLFRSLFALQRTTLEGMTLTKEEEEGKASVFMNRHAVTKHIKKRAYAEGFFEMVADADITVFAMVMERPDKAPYEGPELLQCHHRYLFDRVERFMAEEHPNNMALPIYDALDPGSTRIFAASFNSFMSKSNAGRAMQHIVPSPLFVDSALTPGIQIADRFAYALRLHEENELHKQGIVGDPYLATIKRYAKTVWAKTKNYDRGDGFIIHGISRISSAKFDYDLPASMGSGGEQDPEAGIEPLEVTG
jgi:hypothetical protein